MRVSLGKRPDTRDAETRPFSIASLQRTYTGLLDDVMIRYSRDFVGAEFFNKMIAKNVLFGGGMYLNDGYLVNHPVARRFLKDDDSLLRLMITSNFIRVLTRTSSADELATLPELMAKRGNRSFEKLTASTEWRSMRRGYANFANSVYYNNNVRSWPAYDMSAGFCALIDGTFESKPSELGLRHVQPDQLKRVRDAFHQLRPHEGNARDKYERAVVEVTRNERKAIRELMDVANQAYHYNFGLTLTAEEENGVAVDTTIGSAFDELLALRSVSMGQIENLPLIQVPEGIPFEHGALFLPFLDQASKVGGAKRDYLAALRELLSSPAKDVGYLKKKVRDATDQYLDRMFRMFAPRIGKRNAKRLITSSHSIAFASGWLRSRGARRDAIVATSAPTAGLAIELQAQATARQRQFLIERFRLVDAESTFNPSRHRLITLGDIRPQITSLAFNPDKAREFTSKLRKFDK